MGGGWGSAIGSTGRKRLLLGEWLCLLAVAARSPGSTSDAAWPRPAQPRALSRGSSIQKHPTAGQTNHHPVGLTTLVMVTSRQRGDRDLQSPRPGPRHQVSPFWHGGDLDEPVRGGSSRLFWPPAVILCSSRASESARVGGRRLSWNEPYHHQESTHRTAVYPLSLIRTRVPQFLGLAGERLVAGE